MAAIDDPARLAALRDSGLLAGEALPGLDRLLRVAKFALSVPTVMFTAVESDRQVFLGHVGLPESWGEAGETPLTHSYCRFVVTEDVPLIVSDAADDARVRDIPATTDVAVGAYLGVPVRTHGHILGALCAVDTSPRDWTADEVETLEDLALSVETELRLRETTRELTDQLESELLERGFEESMSALAAATSRSWTVGAVVRSIVDNGTDATGAAVVEVALRDNDELRVFDTARFAADGTDHWIELDIHGQRPMAEAARTQRPVVLPDPEALAAWPEFEESVRPLGLRSYVALPVGNTDSGSEAVIGVGWTRQLGGRELPRSVARLGALARQGLDRAHSHQTAREHAELLESLVLPEQLPRSPGLDLAGIYLPPSAGQRVGGDLYDAVLRDDGRVALIVADAVGHDIIGSLVTSRVRNAFTMLSLELRSPSEIMSYINRYLLRSTMSTHITAVVALVDTDAETLAVANAGHLQPRLRQADGAVSPVGPVGEPLMGLKPFEYPEQTVPFALGASVLLFTDGLIERRDHPLTESEQWLARELGDHGGGDAASAVAHFAHTLSSRDDDVALIVARHRETPTTTDLELLWPADRIVLREARAELAQWLDRHPRLDDVLLVATELLTNARASSDPPDGEVTLRAGHVDGRVSIRVTNPGRPFEPTSLEMPDSTQERGRGLAIAAAISELTMENADQSATITALLSD